MELGNYDSDLETSISYRLILNPKVENSNNLQIILFVEGPKMKLSYNISLLNKNKRRKLQCSGKCRIGATRTKSLEVLFDRADILEQNNGIVVNDTLKVLCSLYVNTDSTTSTDTTLLTTESQKQMGKFLHNESFTDVVITVEERKFKAHKLILSLNSPVFEAMFNHEMKEGLGGVVNITGVTPVAVERMLEFMYDRSVPNTMEQCKELLVIADKYGVSKLKKACENVISKHLTNSTVTDILLFADTNDAAFLKDTCLNYIITNMRQIISLPTWLSFVSENPSLISDLFVSISEKVDIPEDILSDEELSPTPSRPSSPLPPRPLSPTPTSATPLPLSPVPISPSPTSSTPHPTSSTPLPLSPSPTLATPAPRTPTPTTSPTPSGSRLRQGRNSN